MMLDLSALSMNILSACNKLLLQTGFFKKSADDLLTGIRFLGGCIIFVIC